MDWNPKTPFLWDWETQALFNGKDCEISDPSDEPVWKFEGDVDVGNVSAFSSGGGTCSGSESGNGLPKSSVSASIVCLTAEMKASEFKSVSSDAVPGNINRILSKGENTSVRVSAEDSKEPIIGLKLGKRTYFEDSSAGHNMKNSSTMTSVPTSPSSAKKPKASQQKLQVYCQVEGCNTDLSKSKEYHRKHRVCAIHSKSPMVIISGQERRFCQQCSRFHGLSEFDQKKRSCRLRLSDHNARRRKPQPETISFNSSLFAPYYDDKHQMNLVFGQTRFGHVNTATSATWDFSGGFKLRQFKDSKSESISAEHQFLRMALPTNSSSDISSFNDRFPFKGTTPEILSQGLKSPFGASSFEGEQDTQRALSLLSTKSFGSGNFGSASTVQSGDVNYISSSTHPSMHTTDVPSGFWQGQQHLVKEHSFNLHDDSFQFQDFQLCKPGHEDSFFYSR